ncbi:hypothetical protein Tco_0819946 [Tanacetum coccineum]|uniref:Uncharacterized protein n=1 Tax=Tanacetum coccineum TaxID=301880 RepID=A0ABQ5AAX3_9ASTR
MTTPKFANTHNLVAFLEKPEESNGFKEIINFLNSKTRLFCCNVNLSSRTSCIEQFWATAKVKTVNGERGTDCLLTDTIFKELARIGDNKESVPKHSYDPSQSGEDRMQLHELMNLCTKLSDRVLALETTKRTQALEIASLKSRVKNLRQKAAKNHKFKQMVLDDTTRRVESYNDASLGCSERMHPKHAMKIVCWKSMEKDVAEKDVSVVDPVTTAGEVVTTTNVEVTTVNAPTQH